MDNTPWEYKTTPGSDHESCTISVVSSRHFGENQPDRASQYLRETPL